MGNDPLHRRRRFQLDRQPKSRAAQLPDGRVLQQVQKQFFLCRYSGDQIAFEQHLQGSQCRRGTHRVPAERSDVAQRRIVRQGLHDRGRRGESADGHAAPETLGQQQYIGPNAIFFKCKQTARAPVAGLYFVEDEQGARFVTAPPQCLEPRCPGEPNARFRLHRFDDHCCHVPVNFFQAGIAVEVDMPHPRQQRVVRQGKISGRHQAGGALGAAVVGLAAGNEVGPAGVAFGQFHSAFGGFGARIDQVHGVEAGKLRGQQSSQLDLRGKHIFAVHQRMPVALELRPHGRFHPRVAVPQGAHADAGDQVEVGLPGAVVEVQTFGPFDLQRERGG